MTTRMRLFQSLRFVLVCFGIALVLAGVWRWMDLPSEIWAAWLVAMLSMLGAFAMDWLGNRLARRELMELIEAVCADAEAVPEVDDECEGEAGYWGVCEDACKTEIYSEGNAAQCLGYQGEIATATPRNDMGEGRSVGRWIWTETGEEDYEQFWVCSECGERSYFTSNYCSDCGAKLEQDGAPVGDLLG